MTARDWPKLLHGPPREVADALDEQGKPTDADELRAALINALRRIDVLERVLLGERR